MVSIVFSGNNKHKMKAKGLFFMIRKKKDNFQILGSPSITSKKGLFSKNEHYFEDVDHHKFVRDEVPYIDMCTV